jgi:hypothetical protein
VADLAPWLAVLVKLTLPAVDARSLLRLLSRHDVIAAEVYPVTKVRRIVIREEKWMQWAAPGERS